VAASGGEGGAFRFARTVLRPFVAVTTRHEWHGLRHVPRSGGCVVVANHLSYFDPLIVAQFLDAAGRAPRFLGKANLFELPVLGALLANAGQIPVYRNTVDAAKALDAAIAAVHDGQCVVIYPEGTLTGSADLWPTKGKTGAARVGLATGCPVVPVAHWGAQHILGSGQKVPRLLPPRTIQVRAGGPIDLTPYRRGPATPEALPAATAEIMDSIVALLAQIRSTNAPPRGGVGEQSPHRDGVS